MVLRHRDLMAALDAAINPTVGSSGARKADCREAYVLLLLKIPRV
jgi:hypothetical protein